MSVGRKVRNALRLTWEELACFLVLYPLSGAFRLATLALPFRQVMRLLGTPLDPGLGLEVSASTAQEASAVRIGKVCRLVSRHTPWECKCLVQALMARAVMTAWGIPWVIRIGVGKGEDAEALVRAHAWTQVGRRVVTGRLGHQNFKVLCAFGSLERVGVTL